MALNPEYQQEYQNYVQQLARQYALRLKGLQQGAATRGMGQSGLYASQARQMAEAQTAEEGSAYTNLLKQQTAQAYQQKMAEEALRRQKEYQEYMQKLQLSQQRNWYEDPAFWTSIATLIAAL